MKKIISSIVLISTASFAYAEPVYLNCSIPSILNGGDVFSVSIDESNGKISQTYPKDSKFSFNANGMYLPNSISYKEDVDGRDRTYVIDRATLSIQMRDINIQYGDNKVFLSEGQCSKVEEVKGNKI
ncbi:hypothetical protein [Methylovulum miyakonense]|uniref:hypothetical protein n=1 Tax=Methylovulum miyakonense TaxID=645578 RepID=UPI0012EC6928|nr:hypothetical protein [Methylovulum miyakonense]